MINQFQSYLKLFLSNVYKLLCLGITILILCFFNKPVYGDIMNNSIDVFYIQHKHPRLVDGENHMGNLIIQNNNPDGFHVSLSSINAGQIAALSGLDGETNIEYRVTFEQLSGRIGDGMTLDLSETDLLTDHYILTGTSQTSSTDVAIKVIVTLYGYDQSKLMAGNYKDNINVNYVNND